MVPQIKPAPRKDAEVHPEEDRTEQWVLEANLAGHSAAEKSSEKDRTKTGRVRDRVEGCSD
jgi:hypothetical protein